MISASIIGIKCIKPWTNSSSIFTKSFRAGLTCMLGALRHWLSQRPLYLSFLPFIVHNLKDRFQPLALVTRALQEVPTSVRPWAKPTRLGHQPAARSIFLVAAERFNLGMHEDVHDDRNPMLPVMTDDQGDTPDFALMILDEQDMFLERLSVFPTVQGFRVDKQADLAAD